MNTRKAIAEWVEWLRHYGLRKFCEAFVRDAQGAQSTCIHCKEIIYLDILEGGGICDWKTEDGDYGCSYSPDTNADGTGGHTPFKLRS